MCLSCGFLPSLLPCLQYSISTLFRNKAKQAGSVPSRVIEVWPSSAAWGSSVSLISSATQEGGRASVPSLSGWCTGWCWWGCHSQTAWRPWSHCHSWWLLLLLVLLFLCGWKIRNNEKWGCLLSCTPQNSQWQILVDSGMMKQWSTHNLRSFKMRGPVIWKEAFQCAKVIFSRGKWVLFWECDDKMGVWEELMYHSE